MADAAFQTAVSLRLQHFAEKGPQLCRNALKDGRLCNAYHDGRGSHALHCQCGGNTTKRHDHLVRAVAKWLDQHSQFPVQLEQACEIFKGPANPHGRMDIVSTSAEGGAEYIDVTVVGPSPAAGKRGHGGWGREGRRGAEG